MENRFSFPSESLLITLKGYPLHWNTEKTSEISETRVLSNHQVQISCQARDGTIYIWFKWASRETDSAVEERMHLYDYFQLPILNPSILVMPTPWSHRGSPLLTFIWLKQNQVFLSPQCLTWLLMGLISIPHHELATFQQLSCNCRYWFWCLRASFQFCIICQLLKHTKSPRFPHKRSLVTPQPCTDSSTRCKGRHSASRRGYLSLNRKRWCASKQPFITAIIIFTLKGRNKKKCREESRTRSSAYSLNNRKHMHRKSFKLGKATDYLPCNTKCSTAPEPFHFPVSYWRYHSVLHL